uniref:Origin recognition complex subunit 3 n=1 Tax=Nomascus leucogenys TaxID=61853 RepID=A0A2I3H665_NOMLE
MATSSVSKGCFAFKPDSKKRKISVPMEDYFNKGKNEPEDKELNKNLFDNLIEFLQKSHSGFQKNSRDLGCQTKLREIPTAALVLGVKVTDHDLTFRSLTEALQNKVTPYVVSSQLVSQLMNCCVDPKSKEGASVQVTQRNTHYLMDSLSSWYMTVTQKTDPKMPSKKRTTSSQWPSPPVLATLKDMESFATKVLQDFIIISSQHLHEFPLILISGITTSIINHRLFPHAVSSLLCIELFQFLSCKEHLTMVLNKLLLTTQFPFKISGKVLQVLTNIFLYHDFSIQNFIKEHFCSQPLSVMCYNLPEAKRRINFLSDNQSSEKQVALLTSERCSQEETQLLLENLHVYHMNYFLVLRCVHKFTSSLPKYPLGRQIRELYRTCLEKNIQNSEEYASVLQLLKMLAKDELMTILEKCFKVFKSSCEKHLGSTAKRIQEFLAQFQSLDETKEEEDASGSQPKGLQKTDVYHLQRTLLEMKELSRSKKETKFEVLREERLHSLHEVVCFGTAHALCGHLSANEALKSKKDICIAYKLHLECSRLINLVDCSQAFATILTAAEKMDANSATSEEMNEIIYAWLTWGGC